MPDRLATPVSKLAWAVNSGRFSQERLHSSLRHIITLKVHMDLISLP